MANDLGKGHVVNGHFASVASDDQAVDSKVQHGSEWGVGKLLCPKSKQNVDCLTSIQQGPCGSPWAWDKKKVAVKLLDR